MLSIWSLVAFLCIRPAKRPWQWRFRGLLIWVLYFSFGLVLFESHEQFRDDHWEGGLRNPEGTFAARVLKTIPRASHTQLILSVKGRVDSLGQLISTSGKALLLCRQEEGAHLPSNGSLIGFTATFEPVRKAQNPYSFDPADYWEKQGISKQAWVAPRQLIVLAAPKRGTLFFVRNRVLKKLKRYLPKNDHLGIAAALVLGDKSFLDKELKSAYSESGAIHVLAVSGLHVGLVYGFFFWILNQLSLFISLGQRTKSGLLLLLLVVYAIFTGASPSVCRAVLMLACWIINKALYKKPSAWNVLCTSAFVILLLNPVLLFDVGFQLSYSAVTGIILLYPVILKCWSPTQIILTYAWKLVCVSVAAQLGTLPWSLYYFHQFPTYFGLSSLIVIPLITLVLIIAFGLLLVSWTPDLSRILGDMLGWLIESCNQVVQFIQQLPMALLSDIWIEEIDMLFYFITLALILQIIKKLSFSLFLALWGILLMWAGYACQQERLKSLSPSFIVYHTNEFFIADWQERGHQLTIIEEGMDSLPIQYASNGWRSYRGIRATPGIELSRQFARSDTALSWTLHQQRFILIGPSSRIQPEDTGFKQECIAIVDPVNPWVEEWLGKSNIRMLVLLPRKFNDGNWKRRALEKRVPVWSIREKGAFVYTP